MPIKFITGSNKGRRLLKHFQVLNSIVWSFPPDRERVISFSNNFTSFLCRSILIPYRLRYWLQLIFHHVHIVLFLQLFYPGIYVILYCRRGLVTLLRGPFGFMGAGLAESERWILNLQGLLLAHGYFNVDFSFDLRRWFEFLGGATLDGHGTSLAGLHGIFSVLLRMLKHGNPGLIYLDRSRVQVLIRIVFDR